jgi:hypothetical protein
LRNENWKDIAELIGIAAIVASLIFVGLQMKQSHDIALADQYQSRSESTQNMYLSLYEGGFSFEGSLTVPLDEQSPSQRDGTIALALWGWTQYDNHHYQYAAGFMDDEVWFGLQNRIQEFYDLCDRRWVWDEYSSGFRTSFIEYINSLEDRCALS